MLTKDIYGKTLSTAFQSATSAYAQKVKPKIVITFLDSRHVDNLSITTNDAYSSNSRGTYAEQMVGTSMTNGYFFEPKSSMSGVPRESFPWAICDAKDQYGHTIKADGNWYAMPNDLLDNYKYMWISPTKSTSTAHEVSGYSFTTAPYVEYTFTERKVNKVRVSTSEFLGKISYYKLEISNQSLSIFHTIYATIDADEYYKDHIIPSSISNDVNKIKITIYSTQSKEDNARIVEISPLYEIDITDYVISHSVDRQGELWENSIPIAGTGSSSASITLDNTTKVFNPFNSQTGYGKYMKKDLKINIYTGWRIVKTDDILVNTYLTSAMTTGSSSLTVSDASGFLNGNSNNTFTLTIDAGSSSEEMVLCSTRTDKTVTIVERGYNGTPIKAHSINATVTFDPYEYVNGGEFYVDEWSGGTGMEATVKCIDKTKFLTEKQITKGFYVQNSTVGDAVKNMLMQCNQPSKDLVQLIPYTQYAKENAIAHYSFSEPITDRSSASNPLDSGLRLRVWKMEVGKESEVRDIKADALDIQLSDYDKAMKVKPYIPQTYATHPSSTYAVDLSNFSFPDTSKTPSVTQEEFYNGVFDGYYIPQYGGNQSFEIVIRNGGVRMYLDDTPVIDSWDRIIDRTANRTLSSYDYLGDYLNLDVGVPYKIRIEFYHADGITAVQSGGARSLSLALYRRPSGGSATKVLKTDCATIIAEDSIGSRDSSWGTVLKNKTLSVTYRQIVNNVATLTTGTVHSLSIGDKVKITGLGTRFDRKSATVVSVPTTTTFTYAVIGDNFTYSEAPSGAYVYNYSINKNLKNRNHYRNNGKYIGQPDINQPTGMVSEPDKKSVNIKTSTSVVIPYDLSLNLINSSSNLYTGEFSIELYAKFNNGAFTGDGIYITNETTVSSVDFGYTFFYNNSGHGFNIHTLSGNKVVSSDAGIDSNKWQHICLTYQSGSLKYYLNGDLKTTTTGVSLSTFGLGDITIGNSGKAFYMDSFTMYNKCLDSNTIKNRYITTQIRPITVFPHLYGNENSAKSIIDGITLGDFGRFYVDEEDKFRYDHYYRFFEPTIEQHQVSQKTISDETHIINADYTVQLQVNKLTVNVTDQTPLFSQRAKIWGAPDNSSLGVVKLTQNITSTSTTIPVNTTNKPPFPTSGYIKIDNEIIKYSSIDDNNFIIAAVSDRGQFDTTAVEHYTNTPVRESRYFEIKYDNSPAFNIYFPLVTAQSMEFPAQISIDRYRWNAYTAELVLSATDAVQSGDIAYIQGVNPLTEELQATSIAGVPIKKNEGSNQVKAQSSTLEDDIRKYGLKEVVIDNEYIYTAVKAKEIADFLIDKFKTPIPVLSVSSIAIPTIQIGDKITISSLDNFDITDETYWVVSHSLNVGDTLEHQLTLRRTF